MENKSISSNFSWRGFVIRWSLALLGIAAAWLIPFDDAKLVRAYITLIIGGITAFKEYETAKQNRKRDEGIAAASHTAEEAKRGRRLSDIQKQGIISDIRTLDFGSRRELDIKYVTQESAETFARDLTSFLQAATIPPFSFANGPQPLPKYRHDGTDQTIGTVIHVRQSAPSAFTNLANALAPPVPEIKFDGLAEIGSEMRIIVGRQKQ